MKVERHGYRFTDKRNTKGGIISVILAVFAYSLMIIGIIIAYKKNGNAGAYVGVMGTGAFLLATMGAVMALRSFKEEDCFYLFTWIGTVANLLLWIGMCLIIGMGIIGA